MTAQGAPRAMVLGCAGVALDDSERRFMADADPAGFILFKRNCESPEQTQALIEALRAAVGRVDAPVLVDQEGGRVVRLGPPHWHAPPAPAQLGALANFDSAAGARAAWLNARLIAADLHALGFTVNCVPVLDLRFPGASKVVGDRSFDSDPQLVATLGRAVADGLRAGGIVPAVKHLPGHGRATADSHAVLPQVDAPLETLRARDFVPFLALRDAPAGLTAHVCYSALDPKRPGTLSPAVIEGVVRGVLGFDGLLVSDDLSMGALTGSVGGRAAAALAAGCDLALHCNGKRDEMEDVAASVPRLAGRAQERFDRMLAAQQAPDAFDDADGRRELEALLAGVAPQ
ncbi:MAG: beta-N-acetylhexosaminidase [Rhodospirillales bacterium]|nr:beta-N-acetylhexosaminidase [Rhodospirillales bacterium]